jgi:lipopolysaccharide export LptBFGC system permease protein LptF
VGARSGGNWQSRVGPVVRRVLIVYLGVYYLLVAGAVATLWRSGMIDHLHAAWTYSLIALAVALGALLWITSRN